MNNGYGVVKKNNHSARQKTLRQLGVAAAVAACFGMDFAQANPTNPIVANGAASFTQVGNLLTVTNTPNAIINWGSFSIGANEITRFMQQSSASAVLNRVGAGRDPSSILGALQSNGRVFLINPNGITFGAGSQINVGGLVASTLNLSDADFLAGRMRFTDGLGNSVINNGNITTGSGGNVYLVGNAVTNNGIITSPKGDVVLAAGNSVELVNPGTPDMRVEIVAPDNQAVNLGQIVADSGRVGIYAGLINHSGTINANSVDVDAAGNITLKATKNIDLAAGSSITANGPSGGTVTVQSGDTTLAAGTIEAKGSNGVGGNIKLLGNLVGLNGNASIDASGQTGGGTVLVGGDYQGKNLAIQNASRTYLGPDAVIRANAITSGDGGKVIVWSDDATWAYGSISARGGALSGNGGFIETSGHYLDVNGIRIAGNAPNGLSGAWLLDPGDITIQTAGADTSIATNNLGGTTIKTSVADNAILTTGTITGALNGGVNVVVQTGAGTQPGDIFINNAINASPSGPTSLSFNATRNINVNADITATLSALNITFVAGGALNLGATTITPNGGTLTVTGQTINVGPGANAIINSNLTIDALGALNVSGGSLTIPTLTLNGPALFSGGAVNVTGNIVNNSVLTLGPGFGNLLMGGGQTITNSAAGTLNINGGSHTFGNGSNLKFINSGVVNVNSGTLIMIAEDVDAAGTNGDTGTWNAGAGAVLNFNNAFRDFLPASVISGGGTIKFESFSGGVNNVNGTYAVTGNTVIDGTTTVNFNTATNSGGLSLVRTVGGTNPVLGGTGNIIVNGPFNWSLGSITGGGTFTTNGTSTIANGVILNGRSWINNGAATLGGAFTANTSITNAASGVMDLNNGSVTTPSLINSGLLKGAGTITGNVSNSGTVAPGASPGIINIVGNYTQSTTGTLQIELGGTVPGSGYDQLAVTGNVSLAGTLQVLQFGGFVAAPTDTFNIITFGGTISGAFNSPASVATAFTGLSASYPSQLVQLSGAVGAAGSSGGSASDPGIVREDRDVFAQTGDDDIFSKLKDYLVCN